MIRSTLLAVLIVATPTLSTLLAQRAVPEASVRYDRDHLGAEFHQQRRAHLMEFLPSDGIAIVLGAPERNRANDVNYEYHQDANLFYLTGTHEAGSALVLAPAGITIDGRTVHEILFVPNRDPGAETWTGRRFGRDRAQTVLGLEYSLPLSRFEEVVGPYVETHRVYHLPFPEGVEHDSDLGGQVALLQEIDGAAVEGRGTGPALASRMLALDDADDFPGTQELLRQRTNAGMFSDDMLRSAYQAFMSAEGFTEWTAWRAEHLPRYRDGLLLSGLLGMMRVAKTEAELTLLRRAIDITVEAQREAMRSIEPGMYEYEAEGLIEFVFRRNGAERPGYPSIVGSGENSVILHYETNRKRMESGDLVVMDVGAEYHGYTADLTRTIPVNGTFTAEQRAIYELVLRAQDAGIAAARAGQPFQAVDQAARQVVVEGLLELGLISEASGHRRFFMHGTSHYIGLHVHDINPGIPLVEGAVLTVEPGIYIAAADDIDPKWWNIGVRIEDDVLVTADGPVNLSEGAPRTVDDIEALMRETGLGNAGAGKVE